MPGRVYYQKVVTLREKLARTPERWPEYRANIFAWLGPQIEDLFRKALREEKTTGRLEENIDSLMVTPSTIEVGTGVTVQLMPPYDKYLTASTGPGYMPPYLPIATWAQAKGLQPQDGQTEEDMVNRIRMGIYARGTSEMARRRYGTDGANPFAERVRDDARLDSLIRRVSSLVGDFFRTYYT